jgi:DNA-binding NtrC family response regulator
VESEATHPKRSFGSPVRALVATVVGGPDASATVSADDAIALGTATHNDLVLTDRSVSRCHLEIRRSEQGIVVTDLGSTNGTTIGPVSFAGATVTVTPGTVVGIGGTRIRIDDGEVHLVATPATTAIGGIRGASLAMRKLIGSVETLAGKDVPVLVLGESGTGKELVARALHDSGPRAAGPFVIVDCGALAPSLLTSELFGHEKGAFTGADRRHIGAFERAHGGTIVLDEVGELSAEHQSALLGVLERRRIRRVGGSQEIPIDARVVAATHRDLRAAVNDGSFRLDLFYRLAVVMLRTPPLRERPEDISVLVAHFLAEEGFEGSIEAAFSETEIDDLHRHPWPGNVRELRNVVAARVATGALPTLGEKEAATTSAAIESYRDARARVLLEFERKYIADLLAAASGNIREAARIGRVDRSHLMDLMRRHGMR